MNWRDNISTPNAASEGKGVSMLLLGRTGAGKTTFTGTMPLPMLLIDLDNGCSALSNRDDIDVISGVSTGALKEIFKDLQNSCEYKSVVLDSLTALQDLSLEESTNGEKPDWEDWQTLADTAIGALKQLSTLTRSGVHTVATVLVVDEIEKAADGSKTLVQVPYMRPAVSKFAYANVDMVGLMRVGIQNRRELELSPNAAFANLKARNPIPIRKIPDPKFKNILDAVEKGRNLGVT